MRVKQHNEFARRFSHIIPSWVSKNRSVVNSCEWHRGHTINVGGEPITKSTKRTKLLKVKLRLGRTGCNEPINVVVVKNMGNFFGERGNRPRVKPRPEPFQLARVGNRTNLADKLAAPDVVIVHVVSKLLPIPHGRNT